MTDKPNDKTESTGDRIIKAREEERRRIMNSRPSFKCEVGISGNMGAGPLPTFTITITGGDPDKLSSLGREVVSDLMQRLPSIAGDDQ